MLRWTVLGSGSEGNALVIESQRTDSHNCIDPNVVIDTDGGAWLAFGSFWTGIKMRRLDASTGKLSADDDTLYALAQRFENAGAVEAPFIIHRDGYYYLFASFDSCCRGVESTYYVTVGRSEQVTGPYVDREGVPMLRGGGTPITFPSEQWKGPGHNAILQTEQGDYIVYHAYGVESYGTSALHIAPLTWDADGWVRVEGENGQPV